MNFLGSMTIYRGEFRKGMKREIVQQFGSQADSGGAGDSVPDDPKENEIVDYLKSLKERLFNQRELAYGEDEIKKMLQKQTKYLNPQNDLNTVDQLLRNIINQHLKFYSVEGDITLETNAGKPTLTFSLLHEYFDLHIFRNEYYYSMDSVFATIKMTIAESNLLIFYIGNPYLSGKLRKVISFLISKEFTIHNIKWSDVQLRNIMKSEMSELLKAKAEKVEARAWVEAKANRLEDTFIYNEIEDGEFTGISYVIKGYSGNSIHINGRKGYVTSDLSDEVLIDYIKGKLLRYATG